MTAYYFFLIIRAAILNLKERLLLERMFLFHNDKPCRFGWSFQYEQSFAWSDLFIIWTFIYGNNNDNYKKKKKEEEEGNLLVKLYMCGEVYECLTTIFNNVVCTYTWVDFIIFVVKAKQSIKYIRRSIIITCKPLDCIYVAVNSQTYPRIDCSWDWILQQLQSPKLSCNILHSKPNGRVFRLNKMTCLCVIINVLDK